MAGAVKAVWEKAALVAESGTVIAAVTAGNELVADGTKISVSHTAGALRWEVSGASAEEDFQIRMRGLGTGTLTAQCGPRRYTMQRDGTFSTKRSIVNEEGELVARTAPRNGTELHVELYDAAPVADLAFITWVLTLMDTPGRRTKI